MIDFCGGKKDKCKFVGTWDSGKGRVTRVYYM